MIGGSPTSRSNRTVKDIITYISKKWDLRMSLIELRLCKSAADIVQQDQKYLTKFDKTSNVKIIDILNDMKNTNDNNNILYLLYDIKLPNINDDEDDYEDSESSQSDESSSSSEKDDNEESKDDEED